MVCSELSRDVYDAILHGHLQRQMAITTSYNNAQEKFNNAQKKVTEKLQTLGIQNNDLDKKNTDVLIAEYKNNHSNSELPDDLAAAYKAFIEARTALTESSEQINVNSRTSDTIKEYVEVCVRQSTAEFQKEHPDDNNWLNIRGHTIEALAIALDVKIIVVDASGIVTYTFNEDGGTIRYIEYEGIFHFRRLEPLL
jgi:hypothetical protein